jgi:hypothetical protein
MVLVLVRKCGRYTWRVALNEEVNDTWMQNLPRGMHYSAGDRMTPRGPSLFVPKLVFWRGYLKRNTQRSRQLAAMILSSDCTVSHLLPTYSIYLFLHESFPLSSNNRQLIFLAAALYPESIADLTQMSCVGVDDLRYLIGVSSMMQDPRHRM